MIIREVKVIQTDLMYKSSKIAPVNVRTFTSGHIVLSTIWWEDLLKHVYNSYDNLNHVISTFRVNDNVVSVYSTPEHNSELLTIVL